MNKRTKELVMAAILTAFSIIITYSPAKLVLPAFTLTLASHIGTLLAMLISPWVAVMTVIGSCIGFAMTIPAPNSIIVIARAASHIIFALVGIKLISKGKLNIILVVLITGVLHALAEGIAVLALTPVILPGEAAVAASIIAVTGTFLHHIIDCSICAPVALALDRAKIIHLPKSLIRGSKNA